jgi:cephalosporin hydroxylase
VPVRQDIIDRLYAGSDPFAGFPKNLFQTDSQGWNSQHEYLATAIDIGRPKIVIEIGVWKGGSTMFMADRLRALQLDAVVIAVDTWLGSWDHWINPVTRQELGFVNGYPNFYYKFLNNVRSARLENYVVPLPLDSLNAYETLKHLQIYPDLVHIDAGHDYRAVKQDIDIWWPQITPGGFLIGDDYQPEVWPDVCRAFDEFALEYGDGTVTNSGNKCVFRKVG